MILLCKGEEMSYVFGCVLIEGREIIIIDKSEYYIFIDCYQEVAKKIKKKKEVLNFLGALYKYSSNSVIVSSNWKALGRRYVSLHLNEAQECRIPQEIAGIFTGIKFPFPIKMAIKDCHLRH